MARKAEKSKKKNKKKNKLHFRLLRHITLSEKQEERFHKVIMDFECQTNQNMMGDHIEV